MVAGGASGLGAAAAKALLQQGARVVVADVNRAAFDSDPDFARYRDSDQQMLEFCHADVTNPDQVSSALDVAEAAFGRAINASVCCAGIATARRTIGKSGVAHSLDEFAKVLNVNTLGTFNVARLSAERMVRGAAAAEANDKDTNETNGCIVLTSSIAAYEGQVGQVAYAASKAAVVGMTLPLARDLAPHKIRVVTIVRMHSFGLFDLRGRILVARADALSLMLTCLCLPTSRVIINIMISTGPRTVSDATAGRLAGCGQERARTIAALSQAARKSLRVWTLGVFDSRQSVLERRGDPHRRGAPDAAIK
jgi:3-hydroxyacyl-CoA dehydrogenase / 3-hydroxy-2-methylbutyryl-CoA dehydrogenase